MTVVMNENQIRQKRLERGLTQHELSVLAGLSSQAHVSAIEHGVMKPTPVTLSRIAHALKCSVNELVE